MKSMKGLTTQMKDLEIIRMKNINFRVRKFEYFRVLPVKTQFR
jgi:hypothetical protein